MQDLMLQQVGAALPSGFETPLSFSQDEGIRNMQLLGERWRAGLERFNGPGEALFAAYKGSQLVGLGGTSSETSYAQPAMRMRRLYVRPDYRSRGAGQELAKACMDQGLKTAGILTCNARASPAAGPFWQRMGFRRVRLPNITHIYRAP